tara:strand:- start:103 stop:618 length:516 start_codon:yes stop_codon:yes gene_type:complete
MAFSKIIAESMDLTDAYNFTGTLQQNGSTIGQTNTPYFVARKSGDHSGISNQTWTKITGWHELSDSDSKFDPSTARFTPTVAGKYYVSLTAWIGTQANTNQYIRIYKNTSGLDQVGVNTGGDANHPIHISAIASLDTDDYLEPFVYFSGSHTKTVYSTGNEMKFSAFLIAT